MTLAQFYTYQEQTFDSFMGTLIKNEGKDARKEIARRAEHEISMSQLGKTALTPISVIDTYNLDSIPLCVRGQVVIVKDSLLGRAIASLAPKYRDVILLAYFIGKNDSQIGVILDLAPNTIRYRRQTSLQRLKDILEVLGYAK